MTDRFSELYDNSSLDSLLDANHFLHHPTGIAAHHQAMQSGGVAGGGNVVNHLYVRKTSGVGAGAGGNGHHVGENELIVQQEGVSLTNLSHDSGLTTSDSQLYAFEENNSFSSSDDLRAERKLSSGSAAAAAKYPGGGYGEFTLPGQVPHTPSTGNPAKRTSHKTNHRDKIYRRLQKKEVSENTLFNRYSGGLHAPGGVGPGGALSRSDYVIDTTQLLLRRTASEESLSVNQLKDDSSPISAVSAHSARLARRRPAAHRKGRAPAPPLNPVVRSNSVNQARMGDRRTADWYRSRSTTRLNNDTTSSSCSTLSDEDSTPHVSRSNSYGRSEGDVGNGSAFSAAKAPHDGSYDIYLRDDHLSPKTSSTTTPNLLFNDTPPGYEETISRQRLLKHYNRSNSFVITTPSTAGSSGSSSVVKTKLVFEDGPPPLPPKTERPPLPPKQRIRLTNAAGLVEDTYVNSEELRCYEMSSSPLTTSDAETAHLVYPAYTAAGARIHVSDVTMRSASAPRLPPKEPSPPKKRLSSQQPRQHHRSGGGGGGGGSGVGVSKTTISATTQTRTTCNAETQTDETDFYLMYQDEDGVWHREGDEDEEEEDDDEEEILLDDIPSSANSSQVIIVDQPDPSPRPMSDDYYRQSPFAHNGPTSSDYHHHQQHQQQAMQMHYQQQQQLHDSSNGPSGGRDMVGSRIPVRHHRGSQDQTSSPRRKLEPTHSVPNMTGSGSSRRSTVDPVIKGEINWSVSQLRSLFNQQGSGGAGSGGQHSPNGGSSSSTSSSTTGTGSAFHAAAKSSAAGHHHLQAAAVQHQRFTNGGDYLDSNNRHLVIDSGRRQQPQPQPPQQQQQQPLVSHTYQRVYSHQNGPLGGLDMPPLPGMQPMGGGGGADEHTDSDQESYV